MNWEAAFNAVRAQRDNSTQQLQDADVRLTLANAEIAALKQQVADLTPKPPEPASAPTPA